MQTFIAPSTRRLVAVLVAILAHPVGATRNDAQLPVETVALRPSALPGFSIAAAKCSICHSVDYVAYQPPDMTLTHWTAEITKMKNTYGAPLDESDIRQVATYLTLAYGDARSVGVAERVASSSAVPQVDPSSGPDVQVLLDKNSCLVCHALQQKVVGPAYRDVADRYRNEPDALNRVEASIRAGGTGRWGTAPMPPFPGLGAPELKALAEFVLTQ